MGVDYAADAAHICGGELGVAATFTPAGGVGSAVRGILDKPVAALSATVGGYSIPGHHAPSVTFQVAAFSFLREPAEGDQFTIAGKTYTVTAPPDVSIDGAVLTIPLFLTL